MQLPLQWDTPHGRASIDCALILLSHMQHGDILAIRQNEHVTEEDSKRFIKTILDIIGTLPPGTLNHPIPIVWVRDGIEWSTTAVPGALLSEGTNP